MQAFVTYYLCFPKSVVETNIRHVVVISVVLEIFFTKKCEIYFCSLPNIEDVN